MLTLYLMTSLPQQAVKLDVLIVSTPQENAHMSYLCRLFYPCRRGR